MLCRWLLVCLAFTAAACTGGSQKQAPAKPVVDPNAPAHERIALTFEGLASRLREAAQDCDEVARELARWNDENRASYGALSKEVEAKNLGAETARYEDRLRLAFTVILDEVVRCRDHQEAQAAFSNFDVIVDP